MKCARFNYYDVLSDSCKHLQFNSINKLTIVGVFLIPAAVGLCQAASLGPVGFQIFVLLLVFNYGKTDASLMNQPVQLGLYFLQAYRNLKKRKLPDQAQVNENIVLLLAPMMISGAVVGLHSKDYIPSLLQMIIQIISLLLLIITTRKKAKQIKSIAIAATAEQINEFEKDVINVGDGILVDMELFFSQIQSVKGRESMIKILPKEILDMDLTIDEHKMKAKDFLNSNQHIGQQIHQNIRIRSLPKGKIILFFLTIIFNIALIYKQPEMHICDSNALSNFVAQFWSRNQLQIMFNLGIFFFTAFVTKTFNFLLLTQLLVLSYIFGLLLGSVGAAAQIAVILLMKSLKGVNLTTQEIQMTVPFLMFSVTLTSTVISLATGLFHDVLGAIVVFFLTIFGQKYFYPIFTSKIKPLFALKLAQIFQVIMLVTFIGQQVEKNMHKEFKSLLVPRKVCN